MLQKHVFAFSARAQLHIGSFACRHSTLIAEVNSCINFNFYITIIMVYLSKIRGNLMIVILYDEVNVDKYVRRSIVVER